MCYSNTGKVCFTPDPHYPAWSYSCPAEEIDVLGLGDKINLWHSFEMDYNTEHAIMLCPDHRETHQTSRLWHNGRNPDIAKNTGSESEQ